MAGIGEALGGVIGGLLGGNAAKMDRAHQKKAVQDAVAVFDQMGLPPDTSKALILQELQRQGVYTPELEQDLSDTFAPSEMAKVHEDEGLKKAQTEALTSMQHRAKVGLSAEDRAALNQVRNEVQRDAEAKRQQVLQQMQARGMGGSGASLVAQLMAGQDAQNTASSQSDQLMAQAQQRALQALGQSGSMAGDMQQAQFGRQSDIARSLDERNRFLQENSIARQQRNVGALNSAQQANLAEQQRIADANAQMQNAEKARQAEAQRLQYDQKMKLAAGKSGQLQNQATYYGDTATAKAQAQKDMGAGLGGAIQSGVAMFSDETLKTNIDESGNEVNSFLDRISKKYPKG